MKLRREKIDLEMNLKAAEVQLLVLVQEHGLLVEFSARDDALAGKLAEKQTEQRVICTSTASDRASLCLIGAACFFLQGLLLGPLTLSI